jgi:hypothetical protein
MRCWRRSWLNWKSKQGGPEAIPGFSRPDEINSGPFGVLCANSEQKSTEIKALLPAILSKIIVDL